MSRMKTFRTYLILFLLLYVFVSFMSYEFVKSTLTDMKNYQIEAENLKIEVVEAKSSKVSGYVKGKIKNTSNNITETLYMKIELISNTGNIITSKYVDISNMKPEEEREFNTKFNAENIESFKITTIESNSITEADHKFKVKIMEVVSSGVIVLTALKFLRFLI